MSEYIENPAQLARVIEWRKNVLGVPEIPKHIIQAVADIDRAQFVPEDQREKAYEDMPLAIGEGQTSSDPAVVAALCAHGAIVSGHSILEVGGGCGYGAAVMGAVVGDRGQIVSVEINQALASRAKVALKRARVVNVKLVCGDASEGWPARSTEAIYDAIIFAAGAGSQFNPKPLLAQLRTGGRVVVPSPQGPVSIYAADGTNPRTVGSAMFVCLRGINSGFR